MFDNAAKIGEVFIAGLITIAVIGILFTAKNTSSVIGASSGFVANSLSAAEGQAGNGAGKK